MKIGLPNGRSTAMNPYTLKQNEDIRTVSIAKYTGTDVYLEIPEEIGGFRVTGILPRAFAGGQMRSVRFPESLEHIEHHAFTECRSLQKVDFPVHLRSVGNYAFYNCETLEYLHLTPHIKDMGFCAFCNCERLSRIVQDKVPGGTLSLKGIIDDLKQRIHVEIRYYESGQYPDGPARTARITFPEYSQMVTGNVISTNRQSIVDENGSGQQIRFCLGNDDIDYDLYDSKFWKMKSSDSFDSVLLSAFERLMFPYLLKPAAEKAYREYLSEHALQAGLKFLQEDDFEKLSFLVKLDLMDKDLVNTLIDRAVVQRKAEYTAFLMQYFRGRFGAAEDTFEL